MAMADPETATRAIRDWLLDESKHIAGTGAFEEAFVERLRAEGLPIVRFTTGVPSLHPQVDSFSTLWEAGKGLSFREFRLAGPRVGVVPGADRDGTVQDALANSPLRLAYDEGRTVRCRLEGPPEEGEFGILPDLRAAGLTDYLVMPIPFSDASNKAVTFATDRAGGFTDAEIGVLDAIRDAYAAVMEVRYLRHLAVTLMNTYVGPVAGRRVLDGQIERGAMETIRAAIWFCDLRGFTALSEILPGHQIVDLLNDYFATMAAAIEAQDGEILKFIGDAVLAIFVDPEDEPRAARRALTAATVFLDAVAALNADRKESRKPELACGVALHFGDVFYGNVGSPDRLDFTVIGPAVNLASRIEGLTRELGRPLLVSAPFVALHGGAFDNLGDFALKGIAERHAIYAPAA